MARPSQLIQWVFRSENPQNILQKLSARIVRNSRFKYPKTTFIVSILRYSYKTISESKPIIRNMNRSGRLKWKQTRHPRRPVFSLPTFFQLPICLLVNKQEMPNKKMTKLHWPLIINSKILTQQFAKKKSTYITIHIRIKDKYDSIWRTGPTLNTSNSEIQLLAGRTKK